LNSTEGSRRSVPARALAFIKLGRIDARAFIRRKQKMQRIAAGQGQSNLSPRRAAAGVGVFETIVWAALRPLATLWEHPSASYRGWRLVAIDGRALVARTLAERPRLCEASNHGPVGREDVVSAASARGRHPDAALKAAAPPLVAEARSGREGSVMLRWSLDGSSKDYRRFSLLSDPEGSILRPERDGVACRLPGETSEGPRCGSHGGRPPWEPHRGVTVPTPPANRPSRRAQGPARRYNSRLRCRAWPTCPSACSCSEAQNRLRHRYLLNCP